MQKLQDKEPISITTPQLMGYRGEVKAKFYYEEDVPLEFKLKYLKMIALW